MGLFEFLTAVLVLFLIYRLALVALGRQGRCRREAPAPEPDPTDEVRIMQEIQRGLTRMEQRIEALETLLGDRVEEHKAPAGEKRP
jgi:hypothetical protein